MCNEVIHSIKSGSTLNPTELHMHEFLGKLELGINKII